MPKENPNERLSRLIKNFKKNVPYLCANSECLQILIPQQSQEL